MTQDLAILSPKTIDVRIEMGYYQPDDAPLIITLGTLSYHEWNGIALALPMPDVKDYMTALGADNLPRPNPDDPDYKKAVARRNEELQYRRVIAALEKGGNAVPGRTIAEQVHWFENSVDVGVGNVLVAVVINAATGGRGRLLTTEEAATFRPALGNGAHAGLSEAATDDSDDA